MFQNFWNFSEFFGSFLEFFGIFRNFQKCLEFSGIFCARSARVDTNKLKPADQERQPPSDSVSVKKSPVGRSRCKNGYILKVYFLYF